MDNESKILEFISSYFQADIDQLLIESNAGSLYITDIDGIVRFIQILDCEPETEKQ